MMLILKVDVLWFHAQSVTAILIVHELLMAVHDGISFQSIVIETWHLFVLSSYREAISSSHTYNLLFVKRNGLHDVMLISDSFKSIVGGVISSFWQAESKEAAVHNEIVLIIVHVAGAVIIVDTVSGIKVDVAIGALIHDAIEEAIEISVNALLIALFVLSMKFFFLMENLFFALSAFRSFLSLIETKFILYEENTKING